MRGGKKSPSITSTSSLTLITWQNAFDTQNEPCLDVGFRIADLVCVRMNYEYAHLDDYRIFISHF